MTFCSRYLGRMNPEYANYRNKRFDTDQTKNPLLVKYLDYEILKETKKTAE